MLCGSRHGPVRGEWDFDLGPVCRALPAPAVVAGLPDGNDGSGRRGYVWHMSVLNARQDRVLSDGQWAEIARDLPTAPGSPAATIPAARGGWPPATLTITSIHVAVVLVRQDTGGASGPTRTGRDCGGPRKNSSAASS
jgi:hypothetical protein